MQNYIIHYKANNRIIWLAQHYLINTLGISEGYLKKRRCMASKDKQAAWQWTTLRGTFYYNYDSIPDNQPTCYLSRLPTALEFVEENMKPQAAVDSGAARHLMLSAAAKYWEKEEVRWFMFECPVSFTQDKAEQLAEGLGILRMLADTVERREYGRFKLVAVKDFYDVATALVKEKSLYGLKTGSAMALRHRIMDFIGVRNREGGDKKERERLYMIPGKYGNQNANIVGTQAVADVETGECAPFDAHKAVMMYLYMNVGKPNKTHKVACYDDYLRIMESMGIRKLIAYRTFCAHTDQLYTKVWASAERHGQAYFNHEYKTYVSAARLQFSNSLWVADGSGVKLKYNDGSRYGNTLYLMRIHDVASTALIGYHISTGKGEDASHVNAALRMAFETSGGYSALDFLSDNHGAFTEAAQQRRLSVLFGSVRTITPGNSQENPAEVFVKLVNKQGRRFTNWLHSSYAAKGIDSVSNPDYMDVSKLPSYEGAVSQVVEMIDRYNNTKGADGLTPLQRLAQKRHPNSPVLSDTACRFAFGHRTRIELANMRGYVKVTKRGINYQYTIPDYEQNLEVISRACGWTGGAEVLICFDEKGCDIYTQDEKYILSCVPTVLAHKSHAEATEESTDALGRLTQRKRKMQTKADNYVSQIVETVNMLEKMNASEMLQENQPEPMHYEHMVALSKDSKMKEETNELQQQLTEAQLAERKRERIRQRALNDL